MKCRKSIREVKDIGGKSMAGRAKDNKEVLYIFKKQKEKMTICRGDSFHLEMIKLLIAVQSRQKSSVSISVLFRKELHFVPVLDEDDDFLVCCLCKKMLDIC